MTLRRRKGRWEGVRGGNEEAGKMLLECGRWKV